MYDDIVENLKKIGFTEYEAKVYSVLVGLGETTAREVSEASGVPRTRVYDILKELTCKGLAEFTQGSPTYYRAVEPELVIGRIKHELVKSADKTIHELKELRLIMPNTTPIWCIRNDWGIKNRVRDFLKKNHGDLTVFCRNPDFIKEYRSELETLDFALIVDNGTNFEGLGFDFKVAKGDLTKIYKDIFIDGIEYSLDCLMVADERESIVITKIGRDKQAIIIKLPLISMLQKKVLGYFTSSDHARQ